MAGRAGVGRWGFQVASCQGGVFSWVRVLVLRGLPRSPHGGPGCQDLPRVFRQLQDVFWRRWLQIQKPLSPPLQEEYLRESSLDSEGNLKEDSCHTSPLIILRPADHVYRPAPGQCPSPPGLGQEHGAGDTAQPPASQGQGAGRREPASCRAGFLLAGVLVCDWLERGCSRHHRGLGAGYSQPDYWAAGTGGHTMPATDNSQGDYSCFVQSFSKSCHFFFFMLASCITAKLEIRQKI